MSAVAPKIARRYEIREICYYLRSGLFQRSYDYSDVNKAFHEGRGPFTCEIKPIEVDSEHEMLWGSPLGWRVLIRVEESQGKERIALKVYKPDGDLYRGPFVYDEFNMGAGVNWLEENLP